MATAQSSAGEREFEALDRVIGSFQRLLDDCERAHGRTEARACVGVARELYPPVRDLAEQIRLTYGEVPSVRAGLARLDQQLA
jgi:hypothetical protein